MGRLAINQTTASDDPLYQEWLDVMSRIFRRTTKEIFGDKATTMRRKPDYTEKAMGEYEDRQARAHEWTSTPTHLKYCANVGCHEKSWADEPEKLGCGGRERTEKERDSDARFISRQLRKDDAAEGYALRASNERRRP